MQDPPMHILTLHLVPLPRLVHLDCDDRSVDAEHFRGSIELSLVLRPVVKASLDHPVSATHVLDKPITAIISLREKKKKRVPKRGKWRHEHFLGFRGNL